MIIKPYIFDLVFYLAILAGGLDLTFSGLQVIRKNAVPLEKPRLLGLLIMKIMQVRDSSQKHNKLSLLIYAPKTMGFYTFVSGISLIIASILMILDILRSSGFLIV